MSRDYSRAETTRILSALVEKRLNANRMYWSAEVTFDKFTDRERRIDYVAFKPYTPEYRYECYSVELGTFECYEVKSCLEDFQSGHGLSFYGDENYLVCEYGLADYLRRYGMLPEGVHILVPDRNHTRLLHRWAHADYNRPQHRTRTAAELLWAIASCHKGDEYLYEPETLKPLPEEDTVEQAMMFLPGHEKDPDKKGGWQGMSGHEPGRLDTCPICGKRFTADDKDVKLYQLQFMRWPLPRNMKVQTIWYRIHDECASGYQQRAWTLPVASLRSFAMRGVCLIDDSGRGRYEYE